MGSHRWLPLILAGTLLIGACSSSNPVSPGATNPTGMGATTGGGSTAGRAEVGGEKISIKGAVADARSGEGVSRAVLIVQALSTDVLPTAVGSGSLEASGSMPSEATVSIPTPPPAPAASAGRQGATAPRRPAPAGDDPKRPRKVSVDGQGQFEIKDMAPGTYQITAYAPGYQALTIVGNRPSGNLNLALIPHKAEVGHEVSGTVMSAASKPAAGVHVVAGMLPGLTIGDSTLSNDEGRFSLKDFKSGKAPIAAYLAESGEIRAWALQPDVPVAVGKDKKTPSPQLTLRAVSNPVIFSGKVAASDQALKPRQVAVQLVTEYGEVPLLTRTPDKEGYFRFSLPALGEGQTYHLIASAASDQGDVVYTHKHKLNASDLKLDLELPQAAKAPSVSGEDPVTITWDGMEGASVYRLRLETTAEEPTTLWEGYSTGTRVSLPDHDVIPLLKKGEKYRLTLSAIKVADGTAYELAGVMAEPWAFAANHAPVEFVYGEATPAAKGTPATGSVEPAPLPVEPAAKPQPKPQVKPQAKPAPKAKPTPKPKATPKPKSGKVVLGTEEPRA